MRLWFLLVTVLLTACGTSAQSVQPAMRDCGVVTSGDPGTLRGGADAIERCESDNRQAQAQYEASVRMATAQAAQVATAAVIAAWTPTPAPTSTPLPTATPEPTATATPAPTATATNTPEPTSTVAAFVVQSADSADDDAARTRLYINAIVATLLVLGGLVGAYFLLRPRTIILPGRGKKP